MAKLPSTGSHNNHGAAAVGTPSAAKEDQEEVGQKSLPAFQIAFLSDGQTTMRDNISLSCGRGWGHEGYLLSKNILFWGTL